MGNGQSQSRAPGGVDVAVFLAEAMVDAMSEDVPVLKVVGKLKSAIEIRQRHVSATEAIYQRQAEIEEDLDYVTKNIFPGLHHAEDLNFLRKRLQTLIEALQQVHELGAAVSVDERAAKLGLIHRNFMDSLSLVQLKMRMRRTSQSSIKFDVATIHPDNLALTNKMASSTFDIYAGDWYPVEQELGVKLAVAVKEYSPQRLGREADDLLEQVLQHAQLQMDATHPNILRLYGVCSGTAGHADQIMVVMPLVRLGSLYGIIHKKRLVGVDSLVQAGYIATEEESAKACADLEKKRTACGILEGIAQGLAFVHGRHVKHSDLKTANVVLDQEEDAEGGSFQYVPKLIDFDAAFICNVDKSPSGPSSKLGGVATAAYRAPEMWAAGQGAVRPLGPIAETGAAAAGFTEIMRNPQSRDLSKADVYSFAMILYEVVTGMEPWEGQAYLAIHDHVCNQRKRPQFTAASKGRACYDPVLERLCEKCASHDAGQRPKMAEVAEKLASFGRNLRERDQPSEPELQPIDTMGPEPEPMQPDEEPIQSALPASNADGGLEAFLTPLGLKQHVQRLHSQGVSHPSQLQSLEEDDLVGVFGFSKAEAESVRTGRARGEDGGPFLEQLQALDINTEPFQGKTLEEVLNTSWEEIQNILPMAFERLKFRNWRRQAKAKKLVKETGVWLQDIVQRSSNGDWSYPVDESEDETEPDGKGGVGTVIGVRTASMQLGDAPKHPGYVKVQWLCTGYMRSYRAGAGGKYDLQYAVAPSADNLTDVPAGGLQLEHLHCTKGYPLGVKVPHFSMFDVRPDACRLIAPYVPGDVVKDSSDGRTSVCVGAKYNARKRKVDLWFHVDGAEGAGVYDNLSSSNFSKVGHKEVKDYNRDEVEGASDGEIDHDEREYVGKNLQPTLRMQTKSGSVAAFDTRREMISKFRVPYVSGDILVDKTDGDRMICIGVARAWDSIPEALRLLPQVAQRTDLHQAKLWFWVERAEGAGVNPHLHKSLSRYTKQGTATLRDNESPWEKIAASAPRMSDGLKGKLDGTTVKLNFPFPTGQTTPTDDAQFDIRPAVVTPILDMKPGEVVTLADQTFILIGVAMGNGFLDLWFLQTTHPGATIIQGWELLVPRLAKRTGTFVDLTKLRDQLRGNRFNPDQLPLASGGGAADGAQPQPCCSVM